MAEPGQPLPLTCVTRMRPQHVAAPARAPPCSKRGRRDGASAVPGATDLHFSGQKTGKTVLTSFQKRGPLSRSESRSLVRGPLHRRTGGEARKAEAALLARKLRRATPPGQKGGCSFSGQEVEALSAAEPRAGARLGRLSCAQRASRRPPRAAANARTQDATEALAACVHRNVRTQEAIEALAVCLHRR